MSKKPGPLAKFIRGRTAAGKAATAKRQAADFKRGKAVPARAAERHAAPQVSPFRAAKQAARKQGKGSRGGK